MMTSVLRDSLGGNCKTIMIATISPESRYTDESVSTCHFAQRVALVKNSASVNEEVEPELVIQRLRAEVRRLREELEFLSGGNEDDDSSCDGDEQHTKLPQHQMNDLTESIQMYVNDRDETSHLDFCGGITLPKIRAVCSIFKEMLLRKPNETIAIGEDRGSGDEESSQDEDDEGCLTPKYARNTNKNGWNEDCRQHTKPHLPDSKGSTIQQKGNDRVSNRYTVCGVPICSDKRVLDEPSLAFSWFKDRYPGLATINKNKSSLKLKYSEVQCNPFCLIPCICCANSIHVSFSLHRAFRPKIQERG